MLGHAQIIAILTSELSIDDLMDILEPYLGVEVFKALWRAASSIVNEKYNKNIPTRSHHLKVLVPPSSR